MYTIKINQKGTLLKPPISERLKSGSVILNPGEEVGSHITHEREEAIIILKGTATIICEGEEEEVGAGTMVYIPREKEHNIVNRSNEVLAYVYLVALLGSGDDAHGHTH